MITIKFDGRLGNNLFQYAVLWAIHKKSKKDFYVDLWKGRFYFKNAPMCSNSENKDKRIFHTYREDYSQVYDEQVFLIQDNTQIAGFYQTEKYFADLKRDILETFSFAPTIINSTAYAMENLGISDRPVIGLHYREGDLLVQQPINPIMTFEYFRRGIDIILEKTGKQESDFDYLLISENPDSDKFNSIKDLKRSRNSEAVDLCLLTSCDHLVISASTFGWWGAYLNQNNPLVIYPRYWCNYNEVRPKQQLKEGWFPADIKSENPNWIDIK